jgi:hypothetical protein
MILCAEKSEEHVELLQLSQSGIRVAQYLTELPPREVLEKTLHNSVRRARERLSTARQDAQTATIESDLPSVSPRRKRGEASKR